MDPHNNPPQTPNQPSQQNIPPNLGFGGFDQYVNILNSGNVPPPPPQYYPQTAPHYLPQFQQPQFSQNVSEFAPTGQYFQQQQLHQQAQTQEQQAGGSKRKAKGKGKGKRKEKEVVEDVGGDDVEEDTQIPWTEKEELALCRAWCATSKNEKDGNGIRIKNYWEAILSKFHTFMGVAPYRKDNSLSSKWRDINNKVTKFNGIYNKLSSERSSGMAAFDVMEAAKKQYKIEKNGHAFELDRHWLILKEDPKWMSTITKDQQQSKRSKSSQSVDVSDGRSRVDLNAGDDEFPDDLFDDIDENPTPLERPIGRDKAKRAGRHAAEREAKSKHMEEIQKRLNDHVDATKERIEMRRQQVQLEQERRQQERELATEQRIINNMNILTMRPPPDMPEEDLQHFLAAKERARKAMSDLGL